MRTFFNRCGNCRENLCLLASGVLPDAERSTLENHLASCADCQKYYDQIKNAVMPLADWESAFLHVAPSRKVEERWDKEFQAAIEPFPSRQAAIIFSVFDWCRDMIWPCRRIWAGFVAVWLGIFAINLSTRDTAQSMAMKSSPPPAEMVKAFLQSEKARIEFDPDKPGENRVTQPPQQPSSPSQS